MSSCAKRDRDLDTLRPRVSSRERDSTRENSGVIGQIAKSMSKGKLNPINLDPANPQKHAMQAKLTGRTQTEDKTMKRRGSVNRESAIMIDDRPKLLNADGEWAVHPDDADYRAWFMATLLLVIYNSVMLPFELMFYDVPTEVQRHTTFWFWLDTLIDFVFLTDLWITFRLGYIEEEKGELVVSR